jgi:hypothetical protein
MRILIDGKPHDPLTPAQESDISVSRELDSAQGSMLSADDATRAYLEQIRWLCVIAGGLFFLLSGAIALLAEPVDRPAVCGVVIVANLSVAGALFFFLRRRARAWNDRLGLRLLGLPPAGDRIAFDPTGLGVGNRALPWDSLRIEQADFAEFIVRRARMYRIERLSLASSSGTIVLDPAMMRNGRPIVDNVWRRLRPVAHFPL